MLVFSNSYSGPDENVMYLVNTSKEIFVKKECMGSGKGNSW